MDLEAIKREVDTPHVRCWGLEVDLAEELIAEVERLRELETLIQTAVAKDEISILGVSELLCSLSEWVKK